jgi:hypothetical protein
MASRLYLVVLSFLLVLAVACGGGSPAPASSAPAPTAIVATQPASPPPTSATAAPTAAAPPAIEVRGDPDFVAWTNEALNFLQSRAPEMHGRVLRSIRAIQSVTAGSGMDVVGKVFKVGDVTAHAPGHSRANQLVWYAGTMVHDACHSARYDRGQPASGKDAEVACLTEQREALRLIETGTFFLNYVQGLIDGADDPQNQYWNQPNRHW